MNDTSTPEFRFVENLGDFVTLLCQLLTKHNVPVCIDMLRASCVTFLKQTDENLKMLTHFIHSTHKHWMNLKWREQRAFADLIVIVLEMTPLPPDKTDLEEIHRFLTKSLPQEDRESLLPFVESFIKIALAFVHEQRGPKCTQDRKAVYTKPMMEFLDMNLLRQTWALDLVF